MTNDQYENNTVQITVNIGIFNELEAIAKERNVSVERIIGDLAWIYKSERLAREGVFDSLKQAVEKFQEQAVRDGLDKMTMDEIDEEIAAARRDAALAKTA